MKGIVMLAVLGWLATGTAQGAAVVIDFEDLNAPGNGTGGLKVGNQYADRGVTFNFPTALDFSQGTPVLPGFAHSGTKAIELCYAAEFCTGPLVMDFTAAQRRVKVWVGYSFTLNSPQTVIMRVYDAGGSQIGQGTTTLGPSASIIPITNALEVVVTGQPSIVRATVGFLGAEQPIPEIFNNALDIDDVEFDTEGPAPPCPATQPPALQLTSPVPGSVQSVQANVFILDYTVTTEDPFAQIVLSVAGPNAAARSSTSFISSGRHGPIRVYGLLFPGRNELTVTVQDCRGSAQASATIDYNPIDPTTRFEITGIEVSQAIQDLNNTVPIIAGKRTLVRVYVRSQGPSPEIGNVKGSLSACRTFVGSSYCETYLGGIHSLNTITVDSSTDLTAKRRDLNASLNFELPPEWVTPGFLHLEVGLSAEDTPPLDCDGCLNRDAFGALNSVLVYNSPPVRLRLVSVSYTTNNAPGATVFAPRPLDFDMLGSWLRRAYPSGDIRGFGTVVGSLRYNGSPPTCDDVNSDLADARALDIRTGLTDRRTHYYAMISDAGMFVRGCSAGIPSTVASGPTGPGTFGWDNDGSYGDWYGGHELAHTYGRKHPGFCDGNSKDDDAYPFPEGLIGFPTDYFGLDLGDNAQGIARAVYDPRTYTDVMTYCDFQWLSPYTYLGIFDRLRTLESQGSGVAPALAQTAEPTDDTLLVSGKINLTQGTVQLKPFWRLTGLELTSRPISNNFTIVFLDHQGSNLVVYPFEPKVSTDTLTNEDQMAIVSEVVPFAPGARRIVIAKEGQELASHTVSPNSPVVSNVVVSASGANLETNRLLTWDASDADGDPLTYTVQYSAGGRTNWQTLAVSVREREFLLNLNELPGSKTGRFRVIATDGVNTGQADSQENVDVPNKPPRAHIISPPNASRFTPAQVIVLVGEGLDAEDGSLDGFAMRWTSDMQEIHCLGRSVSLMGLMPGIHTITLTVTDSGGLTDQDSIQIHIQPPPVIADAGTNRVVAAGSRVPLDASSSSGSETLTYGWQIAVKPPGSQASLTISNTAQTEFVADVAGLYEIELSVFEATGAGAITRLLVTATDAPVACQPPLPGLVSWWPGEGNANDYLHAHPGTPQNGTAFTNGKVGQALSFDGVDDRVAIGAASLPPPWTMELWVNRQDSPDASAVLLGDAVTALKMEQWQNTRQVGFTVYGVSDYLFNYTAPTSTWVHLAFVGNTNNTLLYVNGVTQDTNAATMALPLGQWGGDIEGRHTNQFKGLMDEMSVYNRALSATEIQALHAAGSAGKCPINPQESPLDRPVITSIHRLGETVTLTWMAQPGLAYRVQYKTKPDSGVPWQDVEGDVSATNMSATKTDTTLQNETQRYYRVIILP